jgi:hypothetical protein
MLLEDVHVDLYVYTNGFEHYAYTSTTSHGTSLLVHHHLCRLGIVRHLVFTAGWGHFNWKKDTVAAGVWMACLVPSCSL